MVSIFFIKPVWIDILIEAIFKENTLKPASISKI